MNMREMSSNTSQFSAKFSFFTVFWLHRISNASQKSMNSLSLAVTIQIPQYKNSYSYNTNTAIPKQLQYQYNNTTIPQCILDYWVTNTSQKYELFDFGSYNGNTTIAQHHNTAIPKYQKYELPQLRYRCNNTAIPQYHVLAHTGSQMHFRNMTYWLYRWRNPFPF